MQNQLHQVQPAPASVAVGPQIVAPAATVPPKALAPLTDNQRISPATQRFISEFDRAIMFADSYSRLDMLLAHLPAARFAQRREYWFKAFGESWSTCDNLGTNRKFLTALFNCNRQHWHLMMDDDEKARFAALPDFVRIWRGCGPVNRHGLSWSLDQNIAAQFPLLNRYKQIEPILIEALVPKERIVAFKDCREEREIIALVEPNDLIAETKIAREVLA